MVKSAAIPDTFQCHYVEKMSFDGKTDFYLMESIEASFW